MATGGSSRRLIAGVIDEIRNAFTWRSLALMAALLACVVLLAWFATHADPRGHFFCREPTDTQILMFILALPVLMFGVIFGIGECTAWARTRHRRPLVARRHAWTAVGLLGLAIVIGIAAGIGFRHLCP